MGVAGALLDRVERGMAPLDRLRRLLYRALAPWLGPWIRSREVRIALHGAVAVVMSLLTAVVAPLWLLALGPLVFGVPHLVADLRYLVARPKLHRRPGAAWVGALLVLSSVTADLRFGLVGAALAPWLTRPAQRTGTPSDSAFALPFGPVGPGSGGPLRRALASCVLAAVVASALVAPFSTQLALAHAHNLVAIVAWLALAVALHEGAGGTATRVGTAVAALVGAALILGGAFDGWLMSGPRLPGGPSVRDHLAALAPGLEAPWGRRWVVTFAYAQSVHYGTWLRVVPEEGRERPAPRSWEASLVALRRDLGEPLLACAVLACVALAAWALVDLAAARDGYLRLALFHGPMELAVLGLVAAEGRSVLRP